MRPQDLVDLRAPCSVASAGDLGAARETAGLIMQRGYARGRDLLALLEQLTDGG